MEMPFLFAVLKDDGSDDFSHWVVDIASASYSFADTFWMGDDSLPHGETLEPSIDIVKDTHRFESEAVALDFIRQWWAKQ